MSMHKAKHTCCTAVRSAHLVLVAVGWEQAAVHHGLHFDIAWQRLRRLVLAERDGVTHAGILDGLNLRSQVANFPAVQGVHLGRVRGPRLGPWPSGEGQADVCVRVCVPRKGRAGRERRSWILRGG